MELRQMASAILYSENKFLMLKKQRGRLFDFEHWSSLGGHIEPSEMNTPSIACLREVFEESGIREQDIIDFRLRYMMLRKREDEMRQHFVYFGEVGEVELVNSDEGELHWIDRDKILDLHLPNTTKLFLNHYFDHKESHDVTVGVVSMDDSGNPCVHWTTLTDPLVF